jgi:SAM-dependent methyltransferase/uncharacterized protein YbaR (Trm112 family)
VSEYARERVEERTRAWLDASYLCGVAAVRSRAPVFDAQGRLRRMSRYDFQELQRKLRIFGWLDRLRFESFLDVGSGFDVFPQLVNARYGAEAYYSDLVHSMNLPYGGHALGRLDRAVTINLARLPFADGAFDVVLASEVLEHLVRPVEAIAELLRVTRKYLVMTSLEALAVNRWRRAVSHHRVDVRMPHVERNFLLLDEFAHLFGADLQHENLFYSPALPADPFAPEDEQQAAYGRLTDAPALEAALRRAVAVRDHRPGAMGILLVKGMPGAEIGPPREDPALARWLIERKAALERTWVELLARMDAGTAEFPERERPVAPALLERLRCPDCRGALHRAATGVRCAACGTAFASEHGVPILYPARPPDEQAAAVEALGRICGNDRPRRRSVRRLMRRLGRNEGPPGRGRRLMWAVERRLGVGP